MIPPSNPSNPNNFMPEWSFLYPRWSSLIGTLLPTFRDTRVSHRESQENDQPSGDFCPLVRAETEERKVLVFFIWISYSLAQSFLLQIGRTSPPPPPPPPPQQTPPPHTQPPHKHKQPPPHPPPNHPTPLGCLYFFPFSSIPHLLSHGPSHTPLGITLAE